MGLEQPSLGISDVQTTHKEKEKKSEKEREERERRGGFLSAERFVSHSCSAEKISWDGGGLLTFSADLYLLGPAWYQQAPWLQIGLVGAVRYSKKTNTDQNQAHIKMSLNTATFDPSPQAWESGIKEGNQEVSNISCLWLLEEGKSEWPSSLAWSLYTTEGPTSCKENWGFESPIHSRPQDAVRPVRTFTMEFYTKKCRVSFCSFSSTE